MSCSSNAIDNPNHRQRKNQNSFRITLIASHKPDTVGKSFYVEDGELVNETGGLLRDGTWELKNLKNIDEYAKLVENLGPNSAILFGVPKDNSNISGRITAKTITKRKGNHVYRLKEEWTYPAGPALMPIDIDLGDYPLAAAGAGLKTLQKKGVSIDNVDEVFSEVFSWWGDIPVFIQHSNSNGIYDAKTGKLLSRKCGLHIVIPLSDGRLIKKLAEHMAHELIAAGYGFCPVYATGNAPLRSLMDMSIYQPERLIFDGAPGLSDDLWWDRGTKVWGAEKEPLSIKELGELNTDWEGAPGGAALLEDAEKSKLRQKIRSEYATRRAAELDKRGLKSGNARAIIESAIHTETLAPEWEVIAEDGEVIYVEELLENKEKYDGIKLRDPLEPDYRGGAQVAMAFLKGDAANIFSHAHGGITYYLEEFSIGIKKDLEKLEVNLPEDMRNENRKKVSRENARHREKKEPTRENTENEQDSEKRVKTREELQRLIGKTHDVVGNARDLIKEIVKANLDKPVAQALLNAINNRARPKIGIGVLREIYGEECAKLNPSQNNDQNLAEEVYEKDFGDGDLIYVERQGWYLWSGRNWEFKGATGKELAWLDRVILEREKIVGSQRDPGTNTANFLNGVIRVLKSLCHKEVKWWRGPVVNVRNGELHLVEGKWELRPHDKNRYARSIIDVDYMPGASCPNFKKAINALMEGTEDADDRVKMLMEFMGLACVESKGLDAALFMIGSGANGKSLILDVLHEILGDSASSVRLANLENFFHLATLDGKTANLDPEIPVGATLKDDVFKALVSGDKVDVAHKGLKPYSMTPTVTLISCMNALPAMKDFSDAIFRRAHILKLENIFGVKGEPVAPGSPRVATADAIPELKKDCPTGWLLEQELSGIMSWALDSAADAFTRGRVYRAPSSAISGKEWATEHDQVALWLDDNCSVSEEYEMALNDAYANYREWANENGVRGVLGKITFAKRVCDSGDIVKVRRKSGVFLIGIDLYVNAIASYKNVVPLRKKR